MSPITGHLQIQQHLKDAFRTRSHWLEEEDPKGILIASGMAHLQLVSLGFLVPLCSSSHGVSHPLGKLCTFLPNLWRLTALGSVYTMEEQSPLTTIVLILKMFCVS